MRRSFPVMAVLLLVASVVAAQIPAYPPSAQYPPAAEDPVMDGAFTTPYEYSSANRVLDDLGVGYFYKQHRQSWTVNGVTYPNTITFFDNHYFTDPGYGTLDMYDMNSWKYKWGNITIEVWVFLEGNNPDEWDYMWLDIVDIGSANYPDGFNDDGGFLVRLNEDPSTDRRWFPGDPQPGDADWFFADYYGVFAWGGFNDSAFINGYSNIAEPREIYEWSITMNHVPGTGFNGDDGGIPGVPQFNGGGSGGGGSGDEDNPVAPGLCDPIWEWVTDYKEVDDWKPEMGGWGVVGGPGFVPDGGHWVLMGWDDSMHPVEEDEEPVPVDDVNEVPIGDRVVTGR